MSLNLERLGDGTSARAPTFADQPPYRASLLQRRCCCHAAVLSANTPHHDSVGALTSFATTPPREPVPVKGGRAGPQKSPGLATESGTRIGREPISDSMGPDRPHFETLWAKIGLKSQANITELMKCTTRRRIGKRGFLGRGMTHGRRSLWKFSFCLAGSFAGRLTSVSRLPSPVFCLLTPVF
jgi:hypothetical protein